jgi:pyridoxal phosphate enzyme (YggS family)
MELAPSSVDDSSAGRLEELRANLAAVHARIDSARAACGRTDPVHLIVVTKTFPASDIALLASLGVTDIGENKDQEASLKHAELGSLASSLRWHMIGQLQSNKAKSVAKWADVVHSADRPSLLAPLASGDRSLSVLIQVNLDPVPVAGRGGAVPSSVPELAALIADTPGLVLAGVMGVAPFPGDPVDAFARLAAVRASLLASYPTASMMSAGMSDDLEEAIAAGATHVRVGGAVLGNRSYLK